VVWQVGDKGPAEKEEGFSDQEFWTAFWTAFGGSCISWVEAVARGDVDTMWALLAAALCSCHGLRSPSFQAPAARTVTKQEEPKRDLHEGDLCEASLTAAILRKRRWQQLLAWSLKPDSEEKARHIKGLRTALAGDADPEWAAAAMLSLPQKAMEEVVLKAREVEDEVRAKLRASRRAGFYSWCRAGSEGSMRALFRWVRDGPRSMQSTGIYLKEGRFFAGQAALLAASEDAWWPLWQQHQDPCWSRVVPPRRAPGWCVSGFSAEELQRLVLAMSCAKAPGHDGWAVGRMRQWPLAVWGCVAELFKVVETFRRWPAALRGGVICLLPKAGVQATTVNPLETRPVVLLPLLYRIWAYKRHTACSRARKGHR